MAANLATTLKSDENETFPRLGSLLNFGDWSFIFISQAFELKRRVWTVVGNLTETFPSNWRTILKPFQVSERSRQILKARLFSISEPFETWQKYAAYHY